MHEKLSQYLDQASVALLQAKEGQANELLSQVFDELLLLAPSLSAEKMKVLIQLMEIMHDAQQRRDHIYLVDILQYELIKYINASD